METLFRAPLLHPETKEIDSDLFPIITTGQWWKISQWSLETGKNVETLLREFNPIAEELTHSTVRLVGNIPTCDLPGCLDPDGSVHT